MGKKKGGKKGKKGKADFLVTPEGAQMRIERERHKGGPARGRCHNAMMPAYHHSCSRFATALAPFGFSSVNDIVATPLGVQCTVHGVKEGALFLKWPGGLISPATCAPTKVHNKDELENYGYSRRPESAHIQRAIDDREKAMYEHRRYGSKAPPTAHMRLPLGPHGAAGSQQFQAYKAETANPGSILRPASAPAKSGGAKKK